MKKKIARTLSLALIGIAALSLASCACPFAASGQGCAKACCGDCSNCADCAKGTCKSCDKTGS